MPIIDFFYRFCDFDNMVLCSLNVVKQQSIVCWNMLWWKYALVKICCGENMLWWKYAVVQICYDENMLWWKYAMVKIYCGENILWWKYSVVGENMLRCFFPRQATPSDFWNTQGRLCLEIGKTPVFLWIISKFSVNYFPNVVIFTCMIHVLLVKIMQMTVLFLLTNHQFDNTQ